MFEKIVVGTDGSAESEKAIRAACVLASKFGSQIHLVHTPQPKTVAFAMGAVAGYRTATSMPSIEEVEQASKKIVDTAKELAAQCNQSIADVHVERGEPAEQILACVESCGADLIVMGRRGLGGIDSLVQGSTSQRVNHLAKCACMTVV